MTSTTFFIVFIPVLAIILLAVNLILAPHNPYQEKDSVFECGFHSFLGQNRTQFSISFFIFALLFLLFDLEILLVYPFSVSGYNNDIYGLVIMLVFFVALTLGFVFELGKNALSIESKQTLSHVNREIPKPHAYIDDLDLQSSPKPHAFTSLPLQSVVTNPLDLRLINALAYADHIEDEDAQFVRENIGKMSKEAQEEVSTMIYGHPYALIVTPFGSTDGSNVRSIDPVTKKPVDGTSGSKDGNNSDGTSGSKDGNNSGGTSGN
jgi:NADH-ubiquinone oxidoreductase chain 3